MTARRRSSQPGIHPYGATLASVMLDAAIQASDRTQAEIARSLGYRNASTLSHYASGLQPISIDASERIASNVGLDTRTFVLAVLRQRHPEVTSEALVPAPFDQKQIAAMRDRLNSQGRPAANDLLQTLNVPTRGSALRCDLNG